MQQIDGSGKKKEAQSIMHRLKKKWHTLRSKYNDTPHHSFHLTPRIKRNYNLKEVKEAWALIIESAQFIKEHSKLLLGLATIYSVFSYFLVGGVSQIDYAALRQSSEELMAGGLDRITTAISYFGAALTGGLTEAPSEVQQITGGILALLFWLIVVWAVRMISAGQEIKIRDALYNGPTAFISTILVMVVLALQLLPAALGLFTFTIALTEQWIATGIAGLAFAGAATLLCLLSLYWLTGSIVAVTIVALPGMYPMQALTSARALVIGKRWGIAMRVLAMLFMQLLVAALILIPIFLIDNWLKFDWLPLVPLFIQVLSGLSLLFSAVYIYKLYRSLL